MIGKGLPLTEQERNDLLESILNAGLALNSLYAAIEAGNLNLLDGERLFRQLAGGFQQVADGYRRRLLVGGTVIDGAISVRRNNGR